MPHETATTCRHGCTTLASCELSIVWNRDRRQGVDLLSLRDGYDGGAVQAGRPAPLVCITHRDGDRHRAARARRPLSWPDGHRWHAPNLQLDCCGGRPGDCRRPRLPAAAGTKMNLGINC